MTFRRRDHRNEFTEQTKQDALLRSRGVCECYRIAGFLGCGRPLSTGNVYFEHINQDYFSHDNSLANCAALTKTCFRRKTDTVDTPAIAKSKRITGNHWNTRAPSPTPMPCGRKSLFKKKMDRKQSVVLRSTGERP